MKKLGLLILSIAIMGAAGCSTKLMDQKEYKARLDYCTKIGMDVQIDKNETSNPTKVDCIDSHGSVFKSKLAY